jgi:hypothetical protein
MRISSNTAAQLQEWKSEAARIAVLHTDALEKLRVQLSTQRGLPHKGEMCRMAGQALGEALEERSIDFIDVNRVMYFMQHKVPFEKSGRIRTKDGRVQRLPRRELVDCGLTASGNFPAQFMFAGFSVSEIEDPGIPVTWAFTELAGQIDDVLNMGSGPSDWFFAYNALELQAQQTLADTMELQAALVAIAVARESLAYWAGSGGASFFSAGVEAAESQYDSGPVECTVSHPNGYDGMLMRVGKADVQGVIAGLFGGMASNTAYAMITGVAKRLLPPPVMAATAVGLAASASALSAMNYLDENITCTH